MSLIVWLETPRDCVNCGQPSDLTTWPSGIWCRTCFQKHCTTHPCVDGFGRLYTIEEWAARIGSTPEQLRIDRKALGAPA